MTIRTTTRDACTIARALRNGEPFTTSGALSGEAYPLIVEGGRLSYDWASRIDRPLYVVRSYATAIAWQNNDGTWVMPDDTYSVTTSKHQSTVRRALRLVGML